MTNKILGTSGTGVNHVHTETDPTILVHNTVPFENQEAAMAALTQSGTILSDAKSPPPITFPARAVDTGHFPLRKLRT